MFFLGGCAGVLKAAAAAAAAEEGGPCSRSSLAETP